jgi:hypothetical protein
VTRPGASSAGRPRAIHPACHTQSVATNALRTGDGGGQVDWDAAFAAWVNTPRCQRDQGAFALELGVSPQTLSAGMTRERWGERAAAIDETVRLRVEAAAVQARVERVDDAIRLASAARASYARRLRDPNYKMTGIEFSALILVEMMVEESAASETAGGGLSEKAKDAFARLPVSAQERGLVAAMTGASLDEILAAEGITLD